MKRPLPVLALILACALCAAAYAQEGAAPEGGSVRWTWILRDDGTAMITGCEFNEAPRLEIPAEAEGRPVTALAEGALGHLVLLREIVIPAGLTELGANPFAGCAALETVTVAEGNPALTVPDGALCDREGTRLVCCPAARPGKTLTVPEGVEELGDRAFAGCLNLREITLPASLVRFGEDLFEGCGDLVFRVMAGSPAADWIRQLIEEEEALHPYDF